MQTQEGCCKTWSSRPKHSKSIFPKNCCLIMLQKQVQMNYCMNLIIMMTYLNFYSTRNSISKRSLYMYANVDHTCDPQLCQVNARACKHTTTMVTPLRASKIHVTRCNPLKDRQTECNYTAIKSRFICARNVD